MHFDLCCVRCDGEHPLHDVGGELVCRTCRSSHGEIGGAPDLVPAEWTPSRNREAARLSRVLADLEAWRRARDAAPRREASSGDAHRARLTDLFARAGVRGDVLDVGGCDGWIQSLLRADDRLAVVDPSPRSERGGVQYARAVAERLPFQSTTFDWVVMLSCLDYFMSPAQALSEAARVLRPGGCVLVLVPVRPAAVARFLDAERGAPRLRRALALDVWRQLGARRVVAEIRAGFTGRPRLHMHYYAAQDVAALLRRRFELRWHHVNDGLFTAVAAVTPTARSSP